MTTVTAEKSGVVGVRFQKLGKMYHFTASPEHDINPGDHVIVETRRGRQLGQVIAEIEPGKQHQKGSLRPIMRKANPRDMVMKQVWQGKELDALITCRERAHGLGLKDVKFVKSEYSYDGSWLIFYYATEDKKLDVGRLRNSLNKAFRTRVEMQLIGPRDVAKIQGGFGACGGPRCCSTFLTEFSPVSIKMAKEQGISLNPQEITGMCGRLRCCLVFEYEQYVEAKKELPKRNKRIGTPHGVGKVRDVRPLRESVIVDIDGERIEVFKHEIEPIEELEALQAKAAAGCAKHEGGGCECGAGPKKSDDAASK